MEEKIEVHFTLTGRFNPDEISQSLGINPTKTWRLGQSIQNTALTYKHDGWRLSACEQKESILEKQIGIILERIAPHSQSLCKTCLRMNLEAEFACVIYAKENQIPEINFSSETIKKIAVLNASIDIDLYLL